jgi:hypothetical protein
VRALSSGGGARGDHPGAHILPDKRDARVIIAPGRQDAFEPARDRCSLVHLTEAMRCGRTET